MALLPTKNQELLDFCSVHFPIWSANPTNIGLSSSQMTAMTSALNTAESEFSAKLNALEAARTAVAESKHSLLQLRTATADGVRFIRAFAESAPDPEAVYLLAQIPAPAPPTPAPAPEAPTELRVAISTTGAVELSWKGSLAQRQFYTVWRQVPAAGGGMQPPVQIGSIAGKSFTDDTLERGYDQVIYQVYGHRDLEASKDPAVMLVYFGSVAGGSGSGGGMIATTATGQMLGFIPASSAALKAAA